MAERTRWQYCQIEVGEGNSAVMKQFFADRLPVETLLHQNWPAMLGKLGEQGWEMVSAFANEGGRGKSPVTYVLKRSLGSTTGGGPQAMPPAPPPPTPSGPPSTPILPDEPEEDEPGFRPLDLP